MKVGLTSFVCLRNPALGPFGVVQDRRHASLSLSFPLRVCVGWYAIAFTGQDFPRLPFLSKLIQSHLRLQTTTTD